MHVRFTFGGNAPLYSLFLAFCQLPLDKLVATVEVLLLLYLVNAEDELLTLLVLFAVLMLDLQLLLANELVLGVKLLVDVGDTPRFPTLSVHSSTRACDPSSQWSLYGGLFLRPRVYVVL
jgi:hypothetical protein